MLTQDLLNDEMALLPSYGRPNLGVISVSVLGLHRNLPTSSTLSTTMYDRAVDMLVPPCWGEVGLGLIPKYIKSLNFPATG